MMILFAGHRNREQNSELVCAVIREMLHQRDHRLIVVGMLANRFTIADPEDGGMLDVVGFDTAAPQVMHDFSAEPVGRQVRRARGRASRSA